MDYAKTINVVKLISMFPNIEHILYRHFMTNMDVKNNFRMYSATLVSFELQGRHFAWQKAFQGVQLPKLTHFTQTDSQ